MKRLLFMTLLSMGAPSAYGAFQIQSPAPNSVVYGLVDFSVDLTGLSNVASVEYLFSGQPFSGPVATPFVYHWTTDKAYNSDVTLTAVARDIDGLVLGTTPAIHFTILNATVPFQNGSTPGLLYLLTPDISQPLSGLQAFQPRTTFRSDLGNYIWNCQLDGAFQPTGFPDLWFPIPSYPIDTTLLSNGPHTFYCHMQLENSTYKNPDLAMQYWTFTVNNPASTTYLGELRANYSDAYLVPGETVQLLAKRVRVDGVETAVPVTYSVEYKVWGQPGWNPVDSNVVTVSPTGVVTGVSQGMAYVHGYSAVYNSTATTRVIVDPSHVFSHFSKSGAMLTSYVPGESIFSRSMFFQGSDQFFIGDPNHRIYNTLGGEVQKAAINVMESGIYSNPADGAPQDFTIWKQDIDRRYNIITDVVTRFNLSLILSGDDLMRNAGESWDSVYNDSSTAKIQYAFTWARDTQRVLGVEMVDETDGALGGDPKPTNGAWLSRAPPMQDDAIVKFMGKVNAVAGRPSITWPVIGLANTAYRLPSARKWMADPEISDYADVYNTVMGTMRPYRDRASINLVLWSHELAFDFAQAVLRRNKPMLSLMSATGPFYKKLGPGAWYTPGQDYLYDAGVDPRTIAAQVTFAAIRGSAGVRVYGFESQYGPNSRSAAMAGTDYLQTFTNPFDTGQDRWRALSSVFNFIRRLEPYLLQPQSHSPDLGSTIVTTVRTGPNGRLLMMLNRTEGPLTVTMDLTPYQYPNSSYMTRHRQHAAEDELQTVPYSASESVTLEGGETVAWVFQPGQTTPPDATPPSVPQNVVAVSSTGISMTWNPSTDNPGGSGIKDYLIYRNGVKIDFSTGPFYTDHLNDSSTFFYRIVARDNAGNVSAPSAPAWGWAAGIDRREPGMSNVQIVQITTGSAVITWTTDEPCLGKVRWGWNASPEWANTPVQEAGNNMSHALALTNLIPNTFYWFWAYCTDDQGNVGQSNRLGVSTQYGNTPFTPIRVNGGNAGSTAYVDTLGRTWDADRNWSDGITGGSTNSGAVIDVSAFGSTEPVVYQTQHWSTSDFYYTFAVPPGSTYQVALKFAELYWTSAGSRTFDVYINGQPVLTRFDVFQEAGAAFKAADKTFTVSPSNGMIRIDFIKGTTTVDGNPLISAIEITRLLSLCDIDTDSVTTAADVQLGANQAIGLAPCTADIRRDGFCNVVDVQRITNAVLGGPCVTP